MYKKVIQGLASGASEHHIAKPSGLGRRVDDTFARGKLMPLSGEASMASEAHCAPRVLDGNVKEGMEESAEDTVVA